MSGGEDMRLHICMVETDNETLLNQRFYYWSGEKVEIQNFCIDFAFKNIQTFRNPNTY